MIVTTKKLFEAAYGKYAVGAFNINNLEQTMGLFRGNLDSQAPFIIQISKGARSFTDKRMIEGLIRAADEVFPEAIFAVHLDHGDEQTASSSSYRMRSRHGIGKEGVGTYRSPDDLAIRMPRREHLHPRKRSQVLPGAIHRQQAARLSHRLDGGYDRAVEGLRSVILRSGKLNLDGIRNIFSPVDEHLAYDIATTSP